MQHPYENLFPADLYHSYIVEGEPNVTASSLLDFLEFRKEIKRQGGDVLCQVYESFSIDDIRTVKEWHSRLGITTGKKVCIIATNFINREAEQALLKILEEPGENTHFFIVVPDTKILLDTILSRTHVVKTGGDTENNFKKIAKEFIALSPKKRFDIVATIIKENKDEENSGKLRSSATLFVNELEEIYFKEFKKNRNNNKITNILNEFQKCREYLSTPGASVKMILEHLAIVI